MTRPAEELESNGAGEAHPESQPLTSNQRDPVGEVSDGDGGEAPVREKLKKTSIASLAQYTNSRTNTALQADDLPTRADTQAEQTDTISNEASGATRGRPARKRSFDDLQNEDTQSTLGSSEVGGTAEKGSHHKRMRSRDASDGEGIISNGQPRTELLENHDEEEESDIDARRSPGGAGVLVEPPAMTESTPPPRKFAADDNTILSPRRKRSRDQFDKDHNPTDECSDDSEESIVRSGSEPVDNDDQLTQTTSRTATGEPEKKRPRDEELKSEINKPAQEVCSNNTYLAYQPFIPHTDPLFQIRSSSSFANTASASPFAAFSRSKSPLAADFTVGQPTEQQPEHSVTSTSAFASSGLSAFSSLEKSPFSSLNSSSANTSGGFGSLTSPEHSSTGFGSARGFIGASPFATKTSSGFGGLGSSGFGGLGSSSLGGTVIGGGFGGTRPLGGGLSSFGGASHSAASFGGGTSAKAFGAPADEGEGDSEDDHEDDSDDEATSVDRLKDRRFQEQDRMS